MDLETRYRNIVKKSGLTAGQVARATGVGSPRSFQRSVLPPAQLQAFENLEATVESLPASTPYARRDLLLDSSSGPSILRRLIDAAPKQQRIQWTPSYPPCPDSNF